MAAPELATTRVALRPLTSADVTAAHEMWTDAGMRRYLWDDAVIGLDTAADVIAASDDDFARRGFGLWGLYDPTSGTLMGFCGCRSTDDHEPELLYGLLPAWWGQGLAVEGGIAVLDHVFLTLEHAEIVAATDPPNTASVRVMEALGMTFHRRGLLNGLDTVFYRLTRQTWLARARHGRDHAGSEREQAR